MGRLLQFKRPRRPDTYDPDDQFFQAFRAGWFHARMAVGLWGNYMHDQFREQRIWDEYVAWLHERPNPSDAA